MSKTYGLLIQRFNRYGTEYVAARLICRESGADYPVNPSSDGESVFYGSAPKHLHGLQLAELGMKGFVSEMNHFQYIGYEVEYEEVRGIHLPQIERMAKTLRKVVNFINKQSAHEPGDYFLAFAKSLKLSFVVEQTGGREAGFYQDCKWRWMTIEEGRNRFRQLIEEATETCKKAQPEWAMA